ncbi:oligosaccharide flippase family protein [Paenibacillus sp. GSMTC-2017]|uniref:oligosaccharide flippase family protein n=1 Tax=Paenibacillus sp. GSMTC-2017 TaxID=2794350 RepID=UPI0018D5E5C6|nr:oligosaccharide flippase family protein [Paenibacillus sp. GSMTC-2017]MBH5320718.1 oligosaccharide flippase family protein [Paenibacillus sp. GSMTC-2017]
MSRNSSSKQPIKFWKHGVMLMAGAALLSKLIGALQKIPLQNIAGDRVFGIYNAVYPFYQLIAVLATAGLPTAVSIIIAQRLREGRAAEEARPALIAAMLLLGASGLIAFCFMWVSADLTAVLIGDKSSAAAIRILSLALLIVPFAAVLRGYMQGRRQMGLSAASQVAEQVMRVAVMLLALEVGIVAGWSESALAAGVMSGATAGAFVALVLLVVLGWPMRTKRSNRTAIGFRRLLREMKELVILAVPATLAALVIPAIGVVDAFMVPRLLRESGLGEAGAMSMFGIYSRAQPLVQLIVMVAGAAAAALVPGLVAARVSNDYKTFGLRLSLLVRLAWTVGAAAALGLVLLADPLNRMFYMDGKETLTFALIGCTALAGCANAVFAPALQALGSARVPIALLLLAALLKGALNAALVPSLGIEGAALSGVAALSAAAILGAAAIRHAAAGFRTPHVRTGRLAGMRPAAGAIVALVVMASAVLLSQRAVNAALGYSLSPRATATALALTGAAVGAFVFAAAALRGGIVSAPEWRVLPGGEGLAARLRRLRLIPPSEQ